MSTLITKAFDNFSQEYLKSNAATIEQYKLINSIKICKTADLGYNVLRTMGAALYSLEFFGFKTFNFIFHF